MDKPALANEIWRRAQRMGELQMADAELLRALARILRGVPIERAFGSPGDWGYSHPIGQAIAAKGDD